MATSVESLDRIIEAVGFLPTTVDRTAAFLMKERQDLWPVSGRGGGKANVHVEAHHLVNLVFGLAADQPSGAVGAVRALSDTYPEHAASNSVGGRHD